MIRNWMTNLDPEVVRAFGQEWSKFDHAQTSVTEELGIFNYHFEDFPWAELPKDSVGFDLGCGSGRWAYFVAPRVGILHCIDPSESALQVARQKLAGFHNCRFHCASVDSIPLSDESADFGYALGVLHHVPDPCLALAQCVRKLKPGAPFLLYVYYAFDNRPAWFRLLWRISDFNRRMISRMPFVIKAAICELLTLLLYWPLARTALLFERCGRDVRNFPLSAYRDRSLYQMRNDALDRFGTSLEKRFTKDQVLEMMSRCGLERIRFRPFPYWCAWGYRAGSLSTSNAD